MHKLFRIRGNGFILFDRFWFYGFRKSGFHVAAHIGGGEWRILNPSRAVDWSLERDGEPVTRTLR